jgi:hypothetical protein
VAKDQVENQYQQEHPANTDSASMPVPAITEPAAEQQNEYEYDQDQVHGRPPVCTASAEEGSGKPEVLSAKLQTLGG